MSATKAFRKFIRNSYPEILVVPFWKPENKEILPNAGSIKKLQRNFLATEFQLLLSCLTESITCETDAGSPKVNSPTNDITIRLPIRQILMPSRSLHSKTTAPAAVVGFMMIIHNLQTFICISSYNGIYRCVYNKCPHMSCHFNKHTHTSQLVIIKVKYKGIKLKSQNKITPSGN